MSSAAPESNKNNVEYQDPDNGQPQSPVSESEEGFSSATAGETANADNDVFSLSRIEIAEAIHKRLRPVLPNKHTAELLNGTPMVEWQLVDQGTITEEQLLKTYSELTGLQILEEEDLEDVQPNQELSYDFLSEYGCLPVSRSEGRMLLAVYQPYNLSHIAAVWYSFFGEIPMFSLGLRTRIEHSLTNLYTIQGEEFTAADSEEASEQALKDLASEAPVVRLVNDMFNRAVEKDASDIHVEPGEENLTVRFRIDGILQTALTPPISYYAAVSSRLKLIAGMNIAERRLPQDGRIDLKVGQQRLDVRVSTIPSVHGESIVLRLLEKDISNFSLNNVGLEEDVYNQLLSMIQKPYGMMLVVGPTGSGKTTTLYGCMRFLNSESRKIITIEEPVEYQIPGLTQIHVRPQIGLSFANGLRSIVRQDPDVILVGEIRDRETAEIAIHAALTGHLVFSTLHTNDAAGAISRLLEMGMEGFLIASALIGVLSQRLVRKICFDCGGSGLTDSQKTCRTCNGTGHRGRTGIFELLNVNQEIREAINNRVDSTAITELAQKAGMRRLKDDGDLKVAAGITDETEVARVSRLEIE